MHEFNLSKALALVGFALVSISQTHSVFAGPEPAAEMQTPPLSSASNLTLGNFFSEGWNQPYSHRSDPDAAPDMALLRVQTNFLEREFRFDFASERNIHGAAKKDVDTLDGLVAYSFNRRFMLEVVSSYEWDDYRVGNNMSGAGGAIVARLQLVDVPGSSYALTARTSLPDTGVGDHETTVSFALAGWQDLTQLGLSRTGLYFHVQEETYAGPGTAGEKRNDITYAVSLAKTWTRPDMPIFGNFTTFVEGYGATNLDGDEKGVTTITVTPGIRMTLGHGNVLIAGVDIPVSNPHPYGVIYRLTYIINF
jgi:hypothetical protein